MLHQFSPSHVSLLHMNGITFLQVGGLKSGSKMGSWRSLTAHTAYSRLKRRRSGPAIPWEVMLAGSRGCREPSRRPLRRWVYVLRLAALLRTQA
ncbi:unnamed protein product [Arctogadus glacialis]